MTRCSYISPGGQSVIAIAQERGGTTDGDIQALRDRFGCKAEATHTLLGDPNKDDDIDACRDHVGHLLGNNACWVHPVVPIDITIEIAHTAGIAREGFGSPMILAPAWSNATPDEILRDIASTTPVVDLGPNPTRRQLEAHGYNPDTAEYRAVLEEIQKARAAFVPMPLPTPKTVGIARSGLVLVSGNQQIVLHPTSVTPGHDGSSVTLRIVAPIDGSRHVVLHDWQNARALIHVDGGGPYAIVERSYAGNKPGEAWTMTLVLKQIQHIVATVEI